MGTIRVIWAGEREAHIPAPGGRTPACYRSLLAAAIEGVAEVTPGSRSVQIRLRDDADPDAATARVRSIVRTAAAEPTGSDARVIELPVCYDADLGPDLITLADHAGLSREEAADLHASGTYTVRFLGFSPGFPYIDGLPETLHAPRLDTPRPRVRAGSVGIAGSRTGIYPQSTPGGWRLIGATPLRLFDPTRDPAALFTAGDRVRFRRIERDEFDRLAREHT